MVPRPFGNKLRKTHLPAESFEKRELKLKLATMSFSLFLFTVDRQSRRRDQQMIATNVMVIQAQFSEPSAMFVLSLRAVGTRMCKRLVQV